MTIAIDLDEVLAEFLLALIAYHNTTYGTCLTRAQFRSYKFWEAWGGTRDEAIQKVYDFHKTSSFKAIRPVAGAQEAIHTLQFGNVLHVITSRQHDVVKATNEWLHQHFPGAFSGIHSTNHFSQSGNFTTKAQICDAVGADVLIEDSIDFAIECCAPHREILLLDAPWNASLMLPPGIVRVHSWREISRILTRRTPAPHIA